MGCNTLTIIGVPPGGCTYTICGPASMYPVLDPRRTAGSASVAYTYHFAWAGMRVGAARNPALTDCQMSVRLTDFALNSSKEIKFWNYLASGPVGNSIRTTPGMAPFNP